MGIIKKLSFLFLGFSGALNVSAQCFLQVKGVVKDADTREKLSGATIEIKALKRIAVTDSTGFFSMGSLCPGHYSLLITHIGCKPVTVHIQLKDDYAAEITLPHRYNELENVTVTSNIGQWPGSINTIIQGKQLDAKRGLSLGETLKEVSGVSLLQTGSNIYKPVIHGLHSSRILILNNGIRQEGQQWGSEHAPEIDPYIANRLTVIKGAGTIRYGGDAIGGVILVEPKLLPVSPGITGEVNTAFFSNNRMGVLSLQVEGNNKKLPPFSWRVQGSVKRGGSSKTPEYWLDNSGVAEYNFSGTAGWRKEKWGTEIFFSQFNTKLGIFSGSHIGNTTDLVNAINSKDPPDYIRQAAFSYSIARPYQRVQHNLLKINSYLQTGDKGRLNVVLARQFNSRQEYDKKRFQSSEDVPQLDLEITTWSADIVWDHAAWKGIRGSAGISGIYQDNWYQYRLFIPQYQLGNLGAFLIEKFDLGRFSFEGGVRYDYRNIYNIFSNDGKIYDSKEYRNFSGNMGIAYRLNDAIRIKVNTSTAWRAPNVNELYSDGLHHGAARLEKGNEGLTPERANTIIAGIDYHKSGWIIETEIFNKTVNGFIFLKPTYPPQLTIRGAFPSFVFAQTNANLYGGDIHASYAFNAHVKVNAGASLLWAWDKTAGDWLIQMPANNYNLSVQYSFADGIKLTNAYVKLGTSYTAKQKRVPATGNIEITNADGSKTFASDYAPPPDGYMLANAEASATLKANKRPVTFTLSADNLLNKRYRNYMNAFRYYADEPGINVALRLKIPLGKLE